MGTNSNTTPLDDQAVREICWMYRNGRTIKDIQKTYHISFKRLKKILEEQGAKRKVELHRGTPSPEAVPAEPLEYRGIPLWIYEDWDVACMILAGKRIIPTRMKNRFCRGKIPGCIILDWLEENQDYK